MTSENKISRLAGLLYLIVVVTGMFSLMYVPSQINVSNDVHATLGNSVAHESLFRFGIAAFIIDQVVWLPLALVLFQLFRTVNRSMAVLMVVFALASVPIGLISVASRLDALSILTNPYFAQALTPEQIQAMAKISLNAYGNGLSIAAVFWGLWLLPFGYLVVKSGFVPGILGIVLIVGGMGYLSDVFGGLLVPHYSDTVFSDYALLPAGIGEIGTCLWLLLFGARRRSSHGARLHHDDSPSNRETQAT